MDSVLRLPCFALLLAVSSPGQINVLTANYDTDRTNSNNRETILNPTTVSPATFGKLGAYPVDGEIYAQPLFVSGLPIGGSLHNVVYTATTHNSIYAFDADSLSSSTPLWSVNLGASVPSSTLNFTDVDVEVGILSTPVIDLSRHVIYVVADTLENGNPTFSLHALSLIDGHEMDRGPVVITASVSGNGDGGKTVTFDARDLLQRPGLALLNREVYVGFGSHGDDVPWHGWMFAYDASNLQHQLSVFCTTPNGVGSSVWQSGRAPAIDMGSNAIHGARGTGRDPEIRNEAALYVATGNGDFNGKTNFGESILRLSPSLALVDWFTPDNYQDLNDNDWDLGSSGVILVPGTNLLVTAGKSGSLYLAPRSAMGHVAPANSTTTQSVNVNTAGIWNIALWSSQSGTTLYVADAFGGPLDAFPIQNGQIAPMQSHTTTFPTTYAAIAISSDGGQDGTGIVWLTTGDFTQTPAPAILDAFDAADLTHQLWSSTANPTRDAMGVFAKFATPTVANGKVFVPTFSNQLAVYGLLPKTPPVGSKTPGSAGASRMLP